MSTICQIIDSLQNLTNAKISQSDIARVFGVTRATINARAKNNSQVTFDEIKKLEKFYNVSLTAAKFASRLLEGSNFSFTGSYKPPEDIIKIPYWSGLPDELKIPDFTCVTAERNVIKNHWYLNPDSLCIVPMFGNKMANYWYKINDSDILIIDTSHNKIVGNGVYFATSQNNTRFWVREMQNLINNDVEFKSFSPSGNTTRVMTKQELEEVDFRIIGKVIKNVSFRL